MRKVNVFFLTVVYLLFIAMFTSIAVDIYSSYPSLFYPIVFALFSVAFTWGYVLILVEIYKEKDND